MTVMVKIKTMSIMLMVPRLIATKSLEELTSPVASPTLILASVVSTS